MYRNLGIDFKRVGKLILLLDDFADKPASVFVRLPPSRIGNDTVAVLSIRSFKPENWRFSKSAGYCGIRKHGLRDNRRTG